MCKLDRPRWERGHFARHRATGELLVIERVVGNVVIAGGGREFHRRDLALEGD